MARTVATPPAARRGSKTPADAAPGRRRAAATEAARRRKRTPGIELDCGAGPDVRHVGIVFVHGIGSQQPAETLLDWGGAIIRLLLDVRVGHEAAADPVIACQLDPAGSESRYIELQLPATTTDGVAIPEQHWVMTEAWWAQRVRPPAFGQMAEWLGPRGAIRRILLAILPRPRGEHDPRLRPSAAHHPLRRGERGIEEAVAAGPVAGMEGQPSDKEVERTPWSAAPMDMKRRMIQRTADTGFERVAKVSAALYLQAVSALILVIYGALRSIEKLLPIGPLRNGSLTRPIDQFVLEWFGDVYVLLGDPAQAASVRGRLVDALSDLHGVDCDTVVVVAHSGGAIVSYMTLADKANANLRVDRLITLGEGLNLAWMLTAGEDGKPATDAGKRYERLYADVFNDRPDLRWHDFWASQDPAPVGVLRVPPAEDDQTAEAEMLGRIESHAIWNRLSFGEDHGTYWENDEEFVLPMLRLVDDRASGASYFGDAADDAVRSNRRRRRLSILSLWRQLSLVAPTAAIVIAFAIGSRFVERASDSVATVWGALPGSDIISGPLNALRGLGIATTTLGGLVAEAGVWMVAALIGLVAIFALIAPPERPVPWAVSRWPWVGGLLGLIPWIVAIPVVLAILYGAMQFVSGATSAGVEVGRLVLAVAGVVVVLALVIPAVMGSPGGPSDGGRRSTIPPVLRDVVELAQTMVVMILASFLVVAPFVAIAAFVDVGRTVLGSLAVVVAFQILGSIGKWRWAVWDSRERMAARSASTGQPGLRRVFLQATLLFAIQASLFLAVILDSPPLVLVSFVGLGLAVLLGVSVDVFDASRRDRTAAADSLLRFSRAIHGR